MRGLVLGAVLGGMAIGVAHAEPSSQARGNDVVIVEPTAATRRRSNAPDRLFLNRCVGGCTVRTGGNDAYTDRSTIPASDASLAQFPFGDAAWNEVVACVRDLYAPYGVEVIDTEPATGISYVEIMVAGTASDIGQASTTLGVAPLTSNCSPQVGVLGFAFPAAHGDNPTEICTTAAHEAGHIYGLEHAFDCKDPMTYLAACGPRTFLNLEVPCGEFDGARECNCTGDTQDSHAKLTRALEVGTIPAAGPVTVLYPEDGEVMAPGYPVFATIDDPRLVIRAELWINGRRVTERVPARSETMISISAPATLSDGVHDVEVRLFTDLGQVGVARLRVTQTVGCDVLDSCATDESCDSDGRCVPILGTAAVGDVCESDSSCDSQRCDGELGVCTQACVTSVAGQCPSEFTCVDSAGVARQVCWPNSAIDTGGCCDTSGGHAPTSMVCVLLVAFGLKRRRRYSSTIRAIR